MSDSDRDTILKGLEEIERQIEAGEFLWRTDREDVHMNIEAALTDLVGEPAKKLHTARSRNDQVATDFRLWCRDAIDSIISRIRNLQVICFSCLFCQLLSFGGPIGTLLSSTYSHEFVCCIWSATMSLYSHDFSYCGKKW